jgi:hypothetical protein
MIVSEVMSPPDCHDDPTTQHGLGSFRGGTRGARHLCSLADKVEQILARADWMLPELLTGRRITRLLGTVM